MRRNRVPGIIQILKKNQTMISLVMLLLKIVVEVVVQALEILVALTQVPFRIFLMIFLVILLVGVGEEAQDLQEDQI